MACQLTFLLSTINMTNQAKAVDRRPPFRTFHAGTAGQPRSQAHDIRNVFFFVRRFPKYVMPVGSVPLVNQQFYEGRRPDVELRLHEEAKAKWDSVYGLNILS